MERRRLHLNLTVLITCLGIALGAQDTLAYWDYRSVVLDIWILVTIIGYWLLYSVRGQRVDSP